MNWLEAALWGVILSLIVVLALSLCGCQHASLSQGDYTSQGVKASHTTTPTSGYVVITRRDGSVTIIPLPAGQEATHAKP